MKTQKEVSNKKANEIIEDYEVSAKNEVDLTQAKHVNKIEVSETVSDLVKQSETIFPQIKNNKFKGENIRVFIYFKNGAAFTEITLKNYEGKVETLCKTIADKIFNTFSTLKGKGKMNIIVEFDSKIMNVKNGRVYHMSRKNMHKGVSALIALQSYAYMK